MNDPKRVEVMSSGVFDAQHVKSPGLTQLHRSSIRGGEALSTTDRRRVVADVRSFRLALRSLHRALNRLAPRLLASIPNGSSSADGRLRPRLSAKTRASMVLQGRYMGYIRQLKPRQKAQVRKIREAKGVRVAILKARQMLAA